MVTPTQTQHTATCGHARPRASCTEESSVFSHHFLGLVLFENVKLMRKSSTANPRSAMKFKKKKKTAQARGACPKAPKETKLSLSEKSCGQFSVNFPKSAPKLASAESQDQEQNKKMRLASPEQLSRFDRSRGFFSEGSEISCGEQQKALSLRLLCVVTILSQLCPNSTSFCGTDADCVTATVPVHAPATHVLPRAPPWLRLHMHSGHLTQSRRPRSAPAWVITRGHP